MKLAIPPGDFDGYIFDLDGTLVDTMPIHYRAWNQAMSDVGMKGTLDEDLFYSLGGVPSRLVAQTFIQHYKLAADPAVLFQKKEALFAAVHEQAKVIEPVAEIARRMSKTRPCAVATGSPRIVADRMLKKDGLMPFFRAIVTADDVLHGKPAPDIFLLAAKQLGVAPQKCLVFEDGEPGFKAAIAAGMQLVRVPSRVVTIRK